MGCEKDSGYYNDVYGKEEKYSRHYKELPYYPMFQVAMGMLSEIENPQILELGCGTGQFAQMLWDNGYLCYLGVDFSETAIGVAMGKSPQAFEVADIKTFKSEGFNTVVMLEVLEHIEEDLSIINRIPEGTNIIFSVPSYDDPAHVRTFDTDEQIIDRYGKLIDCKEIVRYFGWFIVRGVRNGTHLN